MTFSPSNFLLRTFGLFGKWSLSSCEKMQLSDQHWTQISNMLYPRASFTPCHFRSLLYLASASIHKKVETFNAATETFTVLPITLPSLLTPTTSVAFIANGELCLLTKCKQMARWKVETECDFRLSRTSRSSWSTQQSARVGSLVFIAYFGTVQEFSLDTYYFLD